MTFYSLLLLILLVSALVAYLGDRVAKWAGKRHFRLLGLRPRQTATLVAVLTGVGIALLSFLAFLLVFRAAREAILEAEAIRAERQALRQEKARLEEALEAIRSEAAQALAELNALRAERQDLQEALERALVLRKALEEEVQALKEDQKRLLEERRALAQALEEAQREVRLRQERLRGLEARLQALQAQVQAEAEAKARLEEGKKRLTQEKVLLERDLLRLREALARAQREAERARAEAGRLEEVLRTRQREVLAAEERLRGLTLQLGALEAERARLERTVVRLSQGLSLGEVRLGQEEGEEVLRRAAELRARAQGFQGVELLGGARGPGLAFLEGEGYRGGVLLVRVRFYPERRLFREREVLATATFLLSTPERDREALREVGLRARARLLEGGMPPEYALFPAPEDLARGLALLEGKKGVVRVGVVALREVWTVERPLLAYGLLGGAPGPEVPVPPRQVP